MSEIPAHEQQKVLPENSTIVGGKAEDGSPTCPMEGKGWLKGTLGLAICCGAPVLLVAAISFFGLSLGAIVGGALSLGGAACLSGRHVLDDADDDEREERRSAIKKVIGQDNECFCGVVSLRIESQRYSTLPWLPWSIKWGKAIEK